MTEDYRDIGDRLHQAVSTVLGTNLQLKRIDRFPNGTPSQYKNKTKTWRSCDICYNKDRSWKTVAVDHSDNIVRMHHCPRCTGVGKVFD